MIRALGIHNKKDGKRAKRI